MENGIYTAKIERITILSNGTSIYGEWMIFELTLSIMGIKQQKKYKIGKPSWELKEIFPDFYKEKIRRLKDWYQLQGKVVLIFFRED